MGLKDGVPHLRVHFPLVAAVKPLPQPDDFPQLRRRSRILGQDAQGGLPLASQVAAEGGNEDAKRAVDCLCYSIIKYIGSYVAAMNGVDAIAFTGGIGENAIPVRETVVKSLGYLGIKLDEEANQTRGENKVISTADSKVKVAIVPTNEELAICQETAELVKNQK